MTQTEPRFQPGSLVVARGREWVVQTGSDLDWLRLRPLGGSDEDIVGLIPELESRPVEPASFAWPDPRTAGNHAAALLLRDALRLKLRAGAGPFRSFGNIAVEPRAYQLVPLLMALRLSTVRLLIADDVGVGKTIEAGVIVRELMDRGEVRRLAVLCPPHLVEQWQAELEHRFNLHAVSLTSSSAARLERNLPHGMTLFDHHPVIVVSLDYIKSERHREHFLSIAPECIVVDEAHTCTATGRGKQLRFELLQRLTRDPERHLLMLTATPHSGDETAFYNLLSLLDPDFLALQCKTRADDPLRQRLARHFVQRRRKDISDWQAAAKALTTRLENALADDGPANADLLKDERLYDGEADDLETSDLEPPGQIEPRMDQASRLQDLIDQAHRLSGSQGDPKLAILLRHLTQLLDDGYDPVVFCRYVATAHYVGDHLRGQLERVEVEVVTGELTPEERRERIEAMADAERRILVATDCLSEGISLQHLFTAVVHYDLAWNPTRHEQREGRVDRFGQRAPEEIMPEWQRQQQALGSAADVQRFVHGACARLNAPLEPIRQPIECNRFRFMPRHLPESLRLRLADEGLDQTRMLDFDELHRSHPLVTLLAEHLLEASLQGQAQLAARCAVTLTDSVEVVTTLYLLRLRHQLSYVRRREPFQLMAEETLTLAVRGRASPEWLTDETVGQLLECVPSGNLAPALVERELSAALDFLRGQSARLEALAHERAQRLLEDHRRVREAARDVGQYSVSPCLPVDLMGVYVLLPDSL